jgi:hypothetical protein
VIGPAVDVWVPTKLTVQAYDVRDPAHPRNLLYATIDGVFVASRRIGDRVVLVSRHAPSALLDEDLRQRIAGLALGDPLPRSPSMGARVRSWTRGIATSPMTGKTRVTR